MKRILVSLVLAVLCLAAGRRRDPSARSRCRRSSNPFCRRFSNSFGKPRAFSVEATYQASAALTTQIQNGAPFDLFLSADLGYPKRLIDAGLADAAGSRRLDHPHHLCQGHACAVDPQRRHLPPPSLDLLRSPELKRLAIANPDRAPYGRAAVAALTSLKLYDTLKPRLVTAENIAQAAQFVDSGNADAGLISLTSALTPRSRPAAPTSSSRAISIPPSNKAPSSSLKPRNAPPPTSSSITCSQLPCRRNLPSPASPR